MKTIGLIGGLSWESTTVYYKLLNEDVKKRLGGKHSAKIRMYSFDFDEIDKLLKLDDYNAIGKRLVEESKNLEKSGAELIILCANTAHKWANEVQSNVSVPIIHIADATGHGIQSAGKKHVLLLGTKYTMEEDFIKGKLSDDFNIQVSVPNKNDIQMINSIIYDELILGEFKESSKQKILNVIAGFKDIEGVILGCTELPLIILKNDTEIPLFNTTELHANAAIDLALK